MAFKRRGLGVEQDKAYWQVIVSQVARGSRQFEYVTTDQASTFEAAGYVTASDSDDAQLTIDEAAIGDFVWFWRVTTVDDEQTIEDDKASGLIALKLYRISDNDGDTLSFVEIALGGGGSGEVDVSGTPTTGQYARWVDADTLEGVSVATLKTALALVLVDISDAGDLAALDTVGTSEIDDEAVTNAKLAHMAQATIKGRISGGGTGDATDLTPSEVVTIISGTIDAGDVVVEEYGNNITAHVQTSLQNLDDAVAQVVSGELTQTSVSTDTHEPAKANWYFYTTAGGVTVILGSDFEDSGSGLLEKVTGAGTIEIVADSGFTINGSSRVSSTTNVTDAVFTGASGASVSITSAGANLPDLDEGDLVIVRNHDGQADNNGLYVVGSTHTTSSLALTKLVGNNPVDDTSEAIDIDLLDPVTLVSRSFLARRSTNFIVDGGTNEDKSFDGSNLTGIGSQFLDEKAAADTDVAGDGQIWVKSDTPNNLYFTGDTGTDYKLNGGKVLTSISGSLTYAAHHGNTIVTSGNVTVPNAASDVGFQCNIIAGGAHTVTFNSTTSAAMAAGDVMTVLVQSTTVIKASLVEAADLVSFT